MRKILLSLSVMGLVSSGVLAQGIDVEVRGEESTRTHEAVNLPSQAINTIPNKGGSLKKGAQSAAALIWSEDFSSGIPASWTNQGYVVDPNTGGLIPSASADWEYRGPGTTPGSSVGSRGAYAGPNQSGNQGPPIQSATATNGFVIFDSDYLDSGGDRTTMGAGPAPAPHLGTLTTSSIDLSGHPAVELSFASYAREFFADFGIAVSSDGGATFPDTAWVHQDLAVNASSANGDRASADISAWAGNQSNVVLSFIFDGRPGNTNGNGYYYWMIDDLEINDIPPHELRFVNIPDDPNTANIDESQPPNDIIYDGGTSPKYGNLHINQAVPITFDSNVLNYGTSDQTNVQLNVEVVNSQGAIVATLTSPSLPLLATGDTALSSIFTTTGAWTPQDTGLFGIFYYMTSDDISASQATPELAYTIEVNSDERNDGLYSTTFGSIHNYVGTNSIASGSITSIGKMFTFPNSDPDSAGYVFVDGIGIIFSSDTEPAGATIFWQVYDTTGFTYASGPVGSPIFDSVYQVTNIAGTEHFFDFHKMVGGSSSPLILPSNKGYLFVMSMIPNGAGPVLIANDQTVVNQPAPTVVIQTDGGQWFSGFSNSDNLSSPIFLMELGDPPAAPNAAPTASFTTDVTSGNIPLTVNFDASGSSDPEGDALTYTWDFGDGSPTANLVTASHTYNAGGTYTATLTVDDGMGNTDVTTTTITAIDPSNAAPTATFTLSDDTINLRVDPTGTLNVDASGSADPDGDALTYSWDFGDGNTGTGQNAPNNYTNIGTYTVTLTVSDGKGGTATHTEDVEVIDDTDLDEYNASRLSIYPNPTMGDVNLTVGNGGSFTLEVTSLTGKQVYAESITINANEVIRRDFSNLPAGIYMISLGNEEGRSTQKLTIQ